MVSKKSQAKEKKQNNKQIPHLKNKEREKKYIYIDTQQKEPIDMSLLFFFSSNRSLSLEIDMCDDLLHAWQDLDERVS